MDAVRNGAWHYLTKPADADQILKAVQRDPARPAATVDALFSLECIEREHIQRVLAAFDGNISRAAIVLGINRRSLQRKLRKYPPVQ